MREPAETGDRGGDIGAIGRAGTGDAGDRDVIEEAAGVLDDARQAVLLAGRGREAHEIEARSARRLGQLGILLRRQIDDDDPVDPGGDGVLREALRSVAIDRVVIPHQHDRGRLFGAAQLADERQGAGQIHALFQGPLARLLDHRAVGHRIGERHADFDQIGAGFGKAAKQPGGSIGVGIARGQIGDKSGSALLLQRREAAFDAARQSLTPRWSATAKMSLSPRPHMFMTIRWSRGRVGAILATWASAWAGSSAGMMPSIRLDS